MERIKIWFDVFTKVVTCVTFGVIVYCMIFFPQVSFGVEMLWQMLLVSFLTSAGTLLYTDDISQKKMKLMCVIHYIIVNVIVVGCGLWFEWFYLDNLPQMIGILIVIALVFLAVSVVSWKRAMQMADLMNERLSEYQEKQN
ncbi:MAG: DUF3021 family protein [Lachnospiraceae bacterium]|nr:DUF3021 family protein [Lachnospiraceae bacterium]